MEVCKNMRRKGVVDLLLVSEHQLFGQSDCHTSDDRSIRAINAADDYCRKGRERRELET